MGCVWKRKNTWWIKYRRNGRAFYESARTTNHAEAKRLLAQREADSSRGIPVTPEIGKLKFDEAMDALITQHENRKRRSLDKTRGRIDGHLRPAFRGRRMADLTPTDFEAYAAARQKEGASNGTINRELALVRRAFNLAKQADRLLHVPHVPMLAEASPRTGFFSGDEISRLMAALPAHLKPPVKFGYLTGWRLREVLGSIPFEKVIVANADAPHAERVLARLSVADEFEQIFDIVFMQFECKPARGAYERVLEKLGVRGDECILVEDMARNLPAARELGIRTILLMDPRTADQTGAWFLDPAAEARSRECPSDANMCIKEIYEVADTIQKLANAPVRTSK